VKLDLGSKNKLRVRNVLAHYNTKTIPLIKLAKQVWFFGMFIFLKKKQKCK